MFKQKAFTLIELLVVIAIIGILASVVLVSVNSARKKARDTRRKADLHQIQLALEMYYDDNDHYPMVVSQVLSTAGSSWIPGLSPSYMSAIPVDPINDGTTPWNGNGYAYWYDDNAHYDGKNYDLVAVLENPNDPDRCEVKCWKWFDPNQNKPWCSQCSGGAGYSAYIYTGR